ncbi:MAG TPA: HEAT repeat domain-containing protein [Pyrinomonadaceae bacterium]
MSTSVADLVRQLSSPDFNERALALARLIMKGNAATPALTELLKSPDEDLRTKAAQGLAEIADPASADTLAGLLDDENGLIRARAAQGLALMNDPRALDALVRTIDDAEDILHVDHTLSTYGLIRMGPPALPAVAPLLKSDDPLTREHAFLVVTSIVSKLPEGKDLDGLSRSLGSYDPHGAAPERERAADQWLDWISRRG